MYPASMIWPANLASVTLLNAMYEKNEAPDPTVLGGRMPRYRWFAYITLASFVYYFIPGFLAQFLSAFTFVTWIAPNNPVVNQLFGSTSGLSLLPITFDWTQISGFVGSPMIPPWHAIANTLIGVVTFFIIGASIFHYTGTWYAEFLPMSDSGTYDNTGAPYNVSRILTPEFTLDEQAYQSYSPLFISTTFAISYGLSFAAITSLIVYTYLHHGPMIWSQWKNSKNDDADIHMKMMRKYPEAPTWWYMSLFVLVSWTKPQSPARAPLETLANTPFPPTDAGPWFRHGTRFPHELDLVGVPLGRGNILWVRPAHRNHTSDHEQPDWVERVDRVHLWVHPAGPAAGAHDLQDVWLHYHEPVPRLRVGLEVWPLHENPAADHVHGPGRRDDLLVFHPDHRPERGPGQHPRSLHPDAA